MQSTVEQRIHVPDAVLRWFKNTYQSVCKAKDEKCRNCVVIGDSVAMCKSPEMAIFRGIGRSSHRGGMKRVNSVDQEAAPKGITTR